MNRVHRVELDGANSSCSNRVYEEENLTVMNHAYADPKVAESLVVVSKVI